MGKCEGESLKWHGHVTALTVAPSHRKLGVAKALMNHLEHVSEQYYFMHFIFSCRGQMYFVDLFVRESNTGALAMYEKMGYSVYRRVLDYYSGFQQEDGLDLRKALTRDKDKLSVIPHKHPVHADDLDY